VSMSELLKIAGIASRIPKPVRMLETTEVLR